MCVKRWQRFGGAAAGAGYYYCMGTVLGQELPAFQLPNSRTILYQEMLDKLVHIVNIEA